MKRGEDEGAAEMGLPAGGSGRAWELRQMLASLDEVVEAMCHSSGGFDADGEVYVMPGSGRGSSALRMFI